jgi:hypothetical protein
MAFVKFPNLISLQYPTRTEKKAEIALGCSPFQISLFVTMGFQIICHNGFSKCGIKINNL